MGDAGLQDFLFNRQKEHNGIIQKFIDPKGKSNAIIRAIWSPKLCLLEQRVNLKPINDGRYDIYDRCVTYEGAEHQSMNAPVRGIYLPSRLQTICDSIVDHVMRTCRNTTVSVGWFSTSSWTTITSCGYSGA